MWESQNRALRDIICVYPCSWWNCGSHTYSLGLYLLCPFCLITSRCGRASPVGWLGPCLCCFLSKGLRTSWQKWPRGDLHIRGGGGNAAPVSPLLGCSDCLCLPRQEPVPFRWRVVLGFLSLVDKPALVMLSWTCHSASGQQVRPIEMTLSDLLTLSLELW